MNDFVKIDTKRVDEILSSLSNNDTVKYIINEGMKAMGDVYYHSILSSLRSEMGSSADTIGIHKGFYTYLYPLSSGIATFSKEEELTVGIHALKDFRLKFFEGGTKQRYTKSSKILGYNENTKKRRLKRGGKGGYRGFITPNHFFTKGVQNATDNAFQMLQSSIITALRNRGIEIQ